MLSSLAPVAHTQVQLRKWIRNIHALEHAEPSAKCIATVPFDELSDESVDVLAAELSTPSTASRTPHVGDLLCAFGVAKPNQPPSHHSEAACPDAAGASWASSDPATLSEPLSPTTPPPEVIAAQELINMSFS